MDRFIALLASEACRNLLRALAHTLWQGALAAFVLFLYLRRTPAAAANRRYVASVAALGALLLGALVTWSLLSYEPAQKPRHTGPVAAPDAGDTAGSPAISKPVASRSGDSIPKAGEPSRVLGSRQVRIMEAWLTGVALMLLRLAALVAGGNRLRRLVPGLSRRNAARPSRILNWCWAPDFPDGFGSSTKAGNLSQTRNWPAATRIPTAARTT